MTERRSIVIEVRVQPQQLRRWQQHVIDQLAQRPNVQVSVTPVVSTAAPPPGLDLLFWFERLFVGRDVETAADRVAWSDAWTTSSPVLLPDLILDLGPPAAGAQVETAGPIDLIRPTVWGLDPLDGAIAAVLDQSVPSLALSWTTDGVTREAARWQVAIEDRNNALRAVSIVLGRLAHLVLCAVDAFQAHPPGVSTALYRSMDQSGTSASLTVMVAPTLLAKGLRHRITARLNRLLGARVDWRVMHRVRSAGPDARDPASDPAGFKVLPDDGRRFFADPFVMTAKGGSWMFVEEFPYATGKGLIAACEIDAKGRAGPTRPILEQDCHLSYPNVFAHAGEIWMIPETAGRRRVELWRAQAFPFDWVLHAVLVDGVEAADATVAEIDGTWWMFAATRDIWTSSWDTLQIWQAPGLFGPWVAQGPSPAVVEAGSARPAGQIFRLGGDWVRPVQDCRQRYGGALALCRIDRLEQGAYSETIIARLDVDAPLLGLHTWNQAQTTSGLIEVFDIFADATTLDVHVEPPALRMQPSDLSGKSHGADG